MKNPIILILLIILFLARLEAFAQCEVTASVAPEEVVCGDCAILSAFGQGQGFQVFTENFNSGAPTGWAFTQQARFDNPCSPNGVDGTTHIWMGNTSGVPRALETLPYDFSTATSGATVCFDMLFAVQTGDAASAPCEGPDEPDEGVYVQYSTDNGATWNTIHYFDPNGGSDPQLTNWNNWCFQLPPAALDSNVQIRWFQDNDSGADFDHWGIDNVVIYFNDPTYNITWQHDGYAYGQGVSGGDDPTPVCPKQTTDYVVTMSNGTSTCSDTVTVSVISPMLEVDAGPDQRVCDNECVNIDATAKVVRSPAKTPTYSNGEVAPLLGLPDSADLINLLLPCLNPSGCTCPDGSNVAFLGTCPAIFTGTISMNINITDLNTTVLQNGELTTVCVGDANMVIGDLSAFQITLVCPSGQEIILANAGDLSGNALQGACFDLTSTTPIASGTPPYTGNWQPVEPLTNLSGCDANGVWTLQFSGVFDLSTGNIPFGFLNGWNISFDDPEISYIAEFSWDPTAGLSDTNSLQPVVCPTQDIVYTLSASDTADCVFASDDVTITVDTIDLHIAAIVTDPLCGSSNGAIDITVTNGSGNYTYAWSTGDTTEDISGLSAGVFSVTVTDPAHCQEDTSFTLINPDGPVIDSVTMTPETCLGQSDGTANVFATGAGVLTYSWSDGQSGASVTGLASGMHTFTVSDNDGCQAVGTVNIQAGLNVIVSEQITPETCANACDGAISLTATGGAPPLTYTWSDGGSMNPDRTDLCSGTYNYTVSDINNCTENGSIDILAGSFLSVELGPNQSFCEGLSTTLDAGSGFDQYQWSTGDTTRMITVSQTGNYIVTVSLASCQASDTVNVFVSPAPVVNAGNDTTIIIGESITLNGTVSGGGFFFWEPPDDLSCTDCLSPVFTPPGEGAFTYDLVAFDSLECEASDTVTISVIPEILSPAIPSAFTPNGDGRNDIFEIYPPGITVKEFKIYNRWGELVHDDASKGWDGTYQGKVQPMGTYAYYAVVELTDGTEEHLTGAFSLLR